MTLTEYMAWTDGILRYLGGLLTHPAGTPEWEIGRAFALLGDDYKRLQYVGDLLMDRPQGSREHEIAWNLRSLLLRWSAVKDAA